MSVELKEAAQQVLKELGEARKIIRASSSRQLAKDWDRRATDALANLRTAIQQPATPEPMVDVRCEGCGYMTHHREHMGCVRAAKQHTHPSPSVPATDEPVLVQHRKPVEGWSGETIGYTAWRDGKGLDWWPHRELYDRPAPSVPDGYMLVKTEDMVRLVNLIGPAPVEHGGKTFIFNMPNPEENLRLISATVRSMLAAKEKP